MANSTRYRGLPESRRRLVERYTHEVDELELRNGGPGQPVARVHAPPESTALEAARPLLEPLARAIRGLQRLDDAELVLLALALAASIAIAVALAIAA